jgi:hypothetical protein
MLLIAFSADAQAGVLTDASVKARLDEGREQGVIVQYREDTTPAGETEGDRRGRRKVLKNQVMERLSGEHFRKRRDMSELPITTLTLTRPEALRQLQADPEVQFIFPDVRHKAITAQSLPLIQQTSVASVMNRQGAGKAIAVLDTGVTYTRVEFGNCTAAGLPASTCRVSAVYEAATNDNALDSIGHGTEVAMTALAVAPKANIVAVDVFDGNSALSSDIIEGINWVIANRTLYNIGVINLSLGDGVPHTTACGPENGFYSSIRTARNAGLVVVAAAGNEGYTTGIASPACVTNAVAVGATYDTNVGALTWNLSQYNTTTGVVTSTTCQDGSTTADQITCFSNSSAMLDVWAPGALVTVGGTTVAGTSISSPMVSAAVAVLQAQFPTETASQIETRITTTGPLITDARNGIGRRRLDLLAAQGAPGNNAFSLATVVSGNSGSVSTWNFNATAETGEPAHAGQAATRSIWFKWTATESGWLTMHTQGSAIDTRLGAYTGTAVSALSTVTSNDDAVGGVTSSATWQVVAGQTYAIAVDGKNGSSGAVNLGWSWRSTPNVADLAITTTLTANGVEVSVQNLGPQAATQAVVTVSLPAQVSVTNAPTTCTVVTQTSGPQATCNLGQLEAGASQMLSFTVTPALNSLSQVVAMATASSSDPGNGNNTASMGSDSDSADTPLPAWALWLLGAGLWWVRSRC